MITQESYKREKRRLAIASGRFERARRAVPANPFAAESGDELERAWKAAARLFDIAREGLDLFALEGSPDDWPRWDIAERDAAAWIYRNRDNARMLGLDV